MDQFSIHCEGLGKQFNRRKILLNVSLSHKKGVLGIAGSNGSGKSTLMKCMAGLCSSTRGNVVWKSADNEISGADFKKHLGYAAPYINLYDELTCFENLHFILELRDISSKKDQISNVLKQTGMHSFASQTFRDLSTGQRQRMRIAAALVHQPEVLFLDEPGSNLDGQGHLMIKEIVASFKKADKSVVIASNNERELKLCGVVYSVEEEGYIDE